jgi:hypothetical protein|nr:MAG TPA: SAM domain (Sterile alpha motif) [Caudoviricetes sp.]
MYNEFDASLLVEQFLADDLTHNATPDQVKEFCKPGGLGEGLVEAGVMTKRTLVRLSKKDDLDRRTTMAAFSIARAKKDPLWTKLTVIQAKRKELISAIKQKYASVSRRTADKGQKEYIKTMRKVPVSFVKTGGADRV